MDPLTADAMAGGLLQGVSGLAERGRLFSPMLGKLKPGAREGAEDHRMGLNITCIY